MRGPIGREESLRLHGLRRLLCEARGGVRARFETKIYRCPMSGCWLWAAHVNSNGYGTFKLNPKLGLAHRASWTLYVGAIPNGMAVLHRCDVPACVNPNHLFLGTQADNNADKMSKGRDRVPIGESQWKAKLTANDVPLIRADSRPSAEIAREFGVHRNSILAVKARVTWKHVP